MGSPTRVFAIQVPCTRQWVMAATWSALRSITDQIRSCISSEAARAANWIWPTWAGR
ncbi:MAG: hypothetical protein ACREGL_07250 [Alphaproteobacteria bacterium]